MTENQYTPPTYWCPRPDQWHADPEDADAAELEVMALVSTLIRALQPEIVVETGTATGVGAVAIGEALALNGHGHLYTIEIDPGAAILANTAVIDLPVTVYTGNSLEWDVPSPIDFAWIDSGQSDVRAGEVRAWKGKFREGALIGVHDTAPTMGRNAMRLACGNVFADFGWPVLNLRTPRGVMIAQVT